MGCIRPAPRIMRIYLPQSAQYSFEGMQLDCIFDMKDYDLKIGGYAIKTTFSYADTEPMVEYNVVDTGNGRAPVALVQVGKKSSKYFMSETQKKAKIERQRNLLLMAVAYSANIGGTGVITGSPPNLVVPQVS